MEVLYLGHAGFAVDAGAQRLLIDPWFGPAFLNSWWPSPANDHLLVDVLERGCDAVYVSHLHEDHFDRRFLRLLPKSTPVLCPSFRSRSMLRSWKDLGFTDITLVGHEAMLDLEPGTRLTIVHDTSHREDSALLIEEGSFRFLDLNDCLVKMSELPGDVDLLTRQYSGATWYPNCYQYPEAVLDEKVRSMRVNLFDTLVTTCDTSNARWYLPSAGPPSFRDPELSWLNDRDRTIFPVWEDVAERFAQACPSVGVLRARPGDRIVVTGNCPEIAYGQGGPSDDVIESVGRAEPSQSVTLLPTFSTAPVQTEELRLHFERRARRCADLLNGHAKVFVVGTESRAWRVSLGPPPELELSEVEDLELRTGDGVEYTISMRDWVLRAAVDTDDWEDVLLSMRVTLARDPDEYDVRFFGFLRYGHSRAMIRQLIADIEGSTEEIEIAGLRMQRYCPHAGEDLSRAIIADGVIECPRHHWKWDAKTGACLEGGNIPLRVAALDAS